MSRETKCSCWRSDTGSGIPARLATLPLWGPSWLIKSLYWHAESPPVSHRRATRRGSTWGSADQGHCQAAPRHVTGGSQTFVLGAAQGFWSIRWWPQRFCCFVWDAELNLSSESFRDVEWDLPPEKLKYKHLFYWEEPFWVFSIENAMQPNKSQLLQAPNVFCHLPLDFQYLENDLDYLFFKLLEQVLRYFF